MITLSACIEMLWTDLKLDEKVRRVNASGLKAFEFWTWKDKDLAMLRAVQAETGLTVAAFCVEPHFALTGWNNTDEMVTGVSEAAAIARSLGCKRLIVTSGDAVPTETTEITHRRVVRKLKKMAEVAEDTGLTLHLEPLNPIVDHPNQWLTTMAQAMDLVAEVNSPALKILYDIYHQQITEGNIISNLRQYAPWIGHIHVAGVPGRKELMGGELDYQIIFNAIEAIDYEGFVGLEFKPAVGDKAALHQAQSLVQAAKKPSANTMIMSMRKDLGFSSKKPKLPNRKDKA